MKLVVSSKLNKNTIDINNYNKKELTSNTCVNLFISSSINSKKDIILSFKKIMSIKKYTDKKNIVIKNIFENWAKETGATKYMIGVLKDNINARKVYESWGGTLSKYESDFVKLGVNYKEVFYIFDL